MRRGTDVTSLRPFVATFSSLSRFYVTVTKSAAGGLAMR